MPLVHILILTLVALAAYSNTFNVPFILDDEGSIQLHTPVHGLANYFAEGWPGYNYLPNRAFGYLTFALNYEFGGLNVAGYHVVNLGIHIFTALLVYALVRLTFRTPFMRNSPVSPNQSQLLAFVVALLFVSHPIQTQAVTYIVQRLTSLTSMFYLAAIVCYVRWRLPATDESPESSHGRIGWYLLALLSTLLAMKTKEIAVTLPVMILLYELSFFGMPGRNLLVKMTPLLLTIFLIPVTRILHVAPALESAAGFSGTYFSDAHLPEYNITRMTRWDYLFTQFNAIVTYLRLLLFPVNQNLDYDYPINHTLLAPRPFLALLVLLSILALALYMFIRSRQAGDLPGQGRDEQTAATLPFTTPQLLRLASFGIFWFFISISVESSIIVILDVIYEHRLYLPSFGFFLSLTSLGVLVSQSRMKTFYALVASTAFILSIATYSRNNVWRDWITLWSDNVAKSPNKPRPHNILGIGYYYKGDYDNALREYSEAIRLKPDFIEGYYNIGLLHYARKEHQEAINTYVKALSLSAFNATHTAGVYNEIGINYTELGNPEQAVSAFASAVKYAPESIEFRNNYAFALSTAGHLDEAVQQFRKVLQADPANAYALQALRNINPLHMPDAP